MQEQQARVDDVERRAGDPLGLLDVGWFEHALVMAGGVQHGQRLRAEWRVDVDAADLAGGLDAPGHQRMVSPASSGCDLRALPDAKLPHRGR